MVSNDAAPPAPPHPRRPDPTATQHLASAVSEFARTLLTEFSEQNILDHLVVRAVDALPVSAAAVLLVAPDRPARYVAASQEAFLRSEGLQTSLDHGPGSEAVVTGRVVSVPDLEAERTLADFSTAALALGQRSVHSVPLLHSSGVLGALDLYRDTPGPLDERDVLTAQALADVASTYVLGAASRAQAWESAALFRENSLHDALTGLPNRTLMTQRMAHAALRARRSSSVAAVLFADLDDFKHVNDVHGHAVGDQVLIAVADRLLPLLRAGDTLARMSGDEFVFLCEDLSAPQDADMLASRIHEAFAEPFALPSGDISITASVGVAYAGPGETITPELISHADDAMYVAKRYRHAVVPDLTVPDDAVRPRRQGQSVADHLTEDLRNALSAQTLDLVYQPIVRAADGRVDGVESLLRWHHPLRGPVPAQLTVAIAEQAGLVDELGDWIVRRSLNDRSGWPGLDGIGPLDLSLNLSAVQLLNPGLARTLQDAMEAAGADPTTIICEITESILVQDSARALIVLDSLKKLGLRIALDDFGTGYSALTHLRRFPVDIVKIDRSLVDRITSDDSSAGVVSAVVELGHALGLSVVAEGVETPRQASRLTELGCDAAQGHHFARPMYTTDLGMLLSAEPGNTILPAS